MRSALEERSARTEAAREKEDQKEMTFRHTVTLALVGWYLLLPPTGWDGRVRTQMLRYLRGIRMAHYLLMAGLHEKAESTLEPIPAASGDARTTKCQRDEISCLYERTRSRRLHERACCAHFRGTNTSIAVHFDRRSPSQEKLSLPIVVDLEPRSPFALTLD